MAWIRKSTGELLNHDANLILFLMPPTGNRPNRNPYVLRIKRLKKAALRRLMCPWKTVHCRNAPLHYRDLGTSCLDATRYKRPPELRW